MKPRTLVTTVAFAATLGCTQQTPEQRFLNDALTAVGGRARIEALQTFALEGAGVQYNLGQDMRPDAATQAFQVTDYARRVDVHNGRQVVEQTRTPNFLYFQGPQPQRQVQALDGDLAFNLSEKGQATRLAAQAERDRQMEFLHHPIVTLKAATAPTATIANLRTTGAIRQADFTFRDRVWTMAIDEGGLPVSISSRTAHPNLGDVVITTTFDAYQEVNGIKLPARITTKVDDFTTSEITAARQAVDVKLAMLRAAPEIAGTAPAPAAPNVTAEKIGTGVWFLAGQSHHSVLVEFADHLMLIEAPQSEARTLAVIAKAKETVPNKPLTQLVTTHHHFDHTAGLRAAIAEGMTVITQAGNKPWVETMANRPHTLAPDSLARNAARLVVDPVDTEKTFKDASQAVVAYHVAGNPHSDTMLMVYIPRDRLLVEVDAFSPASASHPYAANLLENIRTRNLRVDRIVPLHGGIAPRAALEKAGGAKGN